MAVIINGTTGIVDVDGTAAAPAITGLDTDTGLYFTTNALGLSTGGTAALYINASQNVGIGTTSPSTTLHVSSGSGARIRAGGAVGSGFEFNDASTRFDIPAANTLAFYTSNAERMRIDSAGNVGIGLTPSGTYKLEVNGFLFASNTQLGGANSDADSRLVVNGPITLANSAAQSYKMQAEIDASTTYFSFNRYYSGGIWNLYDATIASSYFISSNTNLNSYFAWATATTNTANPTERLRITANGGVSFGSSGTAYGSTGQALISTGDAPPVWGTAGFGNVTVYTSGTGTFTTPATTTRIKVTVVGGGGGGAGGFGGGGGGGGAAVKIFTVSASTGYSYTVGAAGTAGNSAPNSGPTQVGGTGGTSSFGPVGGTTISATGGVGGNAVAAPTVGTGGAGGTGSNGDLNVGGAGGGCSVSGSPATPASRSGNGGPSLFGGGAQAVTSAAGTTGIAGNAYGGGGSGSGASPSLGGAGAAGVVIVEY